MQSGVSPQPFSDEETIQGAINRARAAVKETGADIGIGLEGGYRKRLMAYSFATGEVLLPLRTLNRF